MTEALVMTRNLYGTNSLETALGRLHIGIAYRSLYEDTALSKIFIFEGIRSKIILKFYNVLHCLERFFRRTFD